MHKRLSVIRFVIVCVLLVSALCGIDTAGALQPPAPGEIAKMKRAGTYDAAVRRARQLGNDKVSPALMEKFYARQTLKALRKGLAPNISNVTWPHVSCRPMPSSGVVRVPVVIIDFWDYPAEYSVDDYTKMLSGSGDANNYPTESLRNYYKRSSYGKLDIVPEVLGIYHYQGVRSSIDTNNSHSEVELVQEAFRYFDNQRTDFTRYDSDGDDAVDYPIVFWSGPSGEWSSFWWGHYGEIGDINFLLDGKSLGQWSWQWESSNASTVIHETGHALGLPDLYDYDATVGPSGGVGCWDVMQQNSGDHNSFSKWMLGWLTPEIVAQGSSSVSLNPLSSNPEALIVAPGFSEADPFKEFYLVEARNKTLNDDNCFFPDDSRLLVWHVDARLNSWYDWAWDNSYTEHKYMRVMEADGLEEIENGVSGDSWAVDLYGPGNMLNIGTFPSSAFYSTSLNPIYVDNISRSGSLVSFIAGVGAPWLANYTVTFDSQGGTSVSSAIVPDGSVVGLPPEPARDGYSFVGWCRDLSLMTPWDFAADTVTSDITLYAKWEINTYTVTFKVSGKSDVIRTVDYNTKTTTPTNPVKSGYKFMGWYTSAGNKFSADSPITGNATYTARFYSTNAYLKKISASAGSWRPKFSKISYSYTVTLAKTKAKVKLTAYRADSKAKVSWSTDKMKWVSGSSKTISVSKGKTKYVYFKVTSQSGATKIYKVKVHRKR